MENKTAEEIKNDFRMIISHALLGYEDTIPKEAWEFVFDECAKYAAQSTQQASVGWSEEEIEKMIGKPDRIEAGGEYYHKESIIKTLKAALQSSQGRWSDEDWMDELWVEVISIIVNRQIISENYPELINKLRNKYLLQLKSSHIPEKG